MQKNSFEFIKIVIFAFLLTNNIKIMLQKLLLANVVVAGLMLAHFPAIALNPNFTKPSTPDSSSLIITQEIDADALNGAAEALEEAANAMSAAQESKDMKESQEHFSRALIAMERSSALLEQAGIPTAAKEMDNAIASVKAALEADTEVEQEKLVQETEKALENVVKEVEEALK
jgi:tetratricopeptide (TPR) repeat protein